jgi:hypothetical protein
VDGGIASRASILYKSIAEKAFCPMTYPKVDCLRFNTDALTPRELSAFPFEFTENPDRRAPEEWKT